MGVGTGMTSGSASPAVLTTVCAVFGASVSGNTGVGVVVLSNVSHPAPKESRGCASLDDSH